MSRVGQKCNEQIDPIQALSRPCVVVVTSSDQITTQVGVHLPYPSCPPPRLPTSMMMTMRCRIAPPEGALVDLQVIDSRPSPC